MNRLSFSVCVVLILLTGCEEAAKSPPATKAYVPEPLLEIESLLPGPRPSSIDGACFFQGRDLFRVNWESHLDQNAVPWNQPWVVVEGIVERYFDRFGAPCVVLTGANWPDIIDCEGDFSRYDIKPGQNAVIIGRLNGRRTLFESRLVTQDEIDRAIQMEHGW